MNILEAQLVLLHAASGLAFKNSALYPRTVIASFVRLAENNKCSSSNADALCFLRGGG